MIYRIHISDSSSASHVIVTGSNMVEIDRNKNADIVVER